MSLSSVLPSGTKSAAPSDCPKELPPPVLAPVLLAVIYWMFANNKHFGFAPGITSNFYSPLIFL